MSNLPSAFKSPEGEAEYMAAYENTMGLWPVPWKAMDIPSRFGSTHLVACGPEEAPPLVLLHCFCTSLTIWAYTVADLSRDYRVYALDMIGQPGKSIPDQPISNQEEMAEWVTDILDALGINKTDVIGYSYGGGAALNYAIHEPDRLKKLILLSPAFGLVSLRTQFFIRGMLNTLLPRLSPHLSKFSANSMLSWMSYQPNLQNEETRRIFDCIGNQFTLGMKYFRIGTVVFPRPYQAEELRRVKASTLLLIGQQEALFDPVTAIARARQLIPKIQAELIPQAGHEMPISKPEVVNKQVLEFLQE